MRDTTMLRYLGLSFVLVWFAAGGTVRAASKPHAVPASGPNVSKRTLTNEDLNRLSDVPGLISIVGQPLNQAAGDDRRPARRSVGKSPTWYATKAARLNARLETEQSELRSFTQALDDVRELKSSTGGINVFEEDIGITPDFTINILENRVQETKRDLDALEDLARRNDIPPGVLRSEWQGVPPDKLSRRNNSQCDMSAGGGDL